MNTPWKDDSSYIHSPRHSQSPYPCSPRVALQEDLTSCAYPTTNGTNQHLYQNFPAIWQEMGDAQKNSGFTIYYCSYNCNILLDLLAQNDVLWNQSLWFCLFSYSHLPQISKKVTCDLIFSNKLDIWLATHYEGKELYGTKVLLTKELQDSGHWVEVLDSVFRLWPESSSSPLKFCTSSWCDSFPVRAHVFLINWLFHRPSLFQGRPWFFI